MVDRRKKMKKEEDLFESSLNIEEERRKQEAGAILYRAIKYIIGYLQGYKIEKQENLRSNPAWIFVKVYWKREDTEKTIEEIEEEIKEMERKREEKMLEEAVKYAYEGDEGVIEKQTEDGAIRSVDIRR
ncbi:hypothetical protein DRN97_04190 [Methanosarcinales archaeon]|nr:MAG: hypothetical protein DRN97_04190 [Methanosarcinales archaeon]